MHEYSLCRQLLSHVLAIAAQYPRQRVEKIHVQLGPLAGVNSDELLEAFPVVSHETSAAHAQLIIEHAPLEVRCIACGHKGDTEATRLVCPQCGSAQLDILSGNEILLKSIEFTATVLPAQANGHHVS